MPSYVNREIQRDRELNEVYLKRNVIIAGRPEFEPLAIEYMPLIESDINQIFLTTLERQYRDIQVVEIQRFHWLFLKRDDTGWELVNMFSIVENLPLEPENNSNGVFARGVKAWLQGCHSVRREEG